MTTFVPSGRVIDADSRAQNQETFDTARLPLRYVLTVQPQSRQARINSDTAAIVMNALNGALAQAEVDPAQVELIRVEFGRRLQQPALKS